RTIAPRPGYQPAPPGGREASFAQSAPDLRLRLIPRPSRSRVAIARRQPFVELRSVPFGHRDLLRGLAERKPDVFNEAKPLGHADVWPTHGEWVSALRTVSGSRAMTRK